MVVVVMVVLTPPWRLRGMVVVVVVVVVVLPLQRSSQQLFTPAVLNEPTAPRGREVAGVVDDGTARGHAGMGGARWRRCLRADRGEHRRAWVLWCLASALACAPRGGRFVCVFMTA